jgi:hypothetical protein
MKTPHAPTLHALTLLTFLTLCCLCGSGCAGMGTLVKQLKGDAATVSVSLTTIYGNLKFVRTNPGTNTETTVTPDGTVTVKRP